MADYENLANSGLSMSRLLISNVNVHLHERQSLYPVRQGDTLTSKWN
jgi:hypothetical protein